MNHKLCSYYIMLLACLFIFSHCSDKHSSSAIKHIGVTEAKKLIYEQKNLQILDVRTKEEIALTGRINGAKEIDWYGDSFEKKLEIFTTDRPIMVYCKSGTRSKKVAKLLKKLNFNTIYNLRGGMNAWNKWLSSKYYRNYLNITAIIYILAS